MRLLACVLLLLAVLMPLLVLLTVLTGDAEPGRALTVALVAILGGAAGFVILRRMRESPGHRPGRPS